MKSRKPVLLRLLLGLGVVLIAGLAPQSAVRASQVIGNIPSVLGRWYSTERFESEARIQVGFRQMGSSIQGWAVLLGQHRKADDRATLALSFSEASLSGQTITFETVLPEDEGTIGWELRVVTPTTAVLRAVTEDGLPIGDELRWDMRR
jgi:hypothetical protein